MASRSVATTVPREVKLNTRAVLLSSKNGVCLKRFSLDYKKLVGSVFPWKKCGFPSPIALLQSMEDVVRFQYSSRDGDYRLYGMGTSDMFMPSWVVKAQGLPPENMDSKGRPILNSKQRPAPSIACSNVPGWQSRGKPHPHWPSVSASRPPSARATTCPPPEQGRGSCAPPPAEKGRGLCGAPFMTSRRSNTEKGRGLHRTPSDERGCGLRRIPSDEKGHGLYRTSSDEKGRGFDGPSPTEKWGGLCGSTLMKEHHSPSDMKPALPRAPSMEKRGAYLQSVPPSVKQRPLLQPVKQHSNQQAKSGPVHIMNGYTVITGGNRPSTISRETKPITTETSTVAMENRPITMETRPNAMGTKGIAMKTRPKAMKTRPGPIALDTRTNDIPPLLLCGDVEQIQSPKGTHAGRRFLYNMRGLVTMYIGWTASEVTPGVMETILAEKLKKFMPPPVEMSFYSGKGFARYSSLSDAERARAHFKGMVLCGTTLRAEPGHEKVHQRENSSESCRETDCSCWLRAAHQAGRGWDRQTDSCSVLSAGAVSDVHQSECYRQTDSFSVLSAGTVSDVHQSECYRQTNTSSGAGAEDRRLRNGIVSDTTSDVIDQAHDQERRRGSYDYSIGSHDSIHGSHDSEGRSRDSEVYQGDQWRVEERFRTLLNELAVSDSDDDDGDSLVGFEWDEALLDDVIPTLATAPRALGARGHREASAPLLSGRGLVAEAPPSLHSSTFSISSLSSSLVTVETAETPPSLVVEDTPFEYDGSSPPSLDGTPPPLLVNKTPPPPLSEDGQCLHGDRPHPPDDGERELLKESGLVPITVARVVSPSELWVQMTSDPESELESLSEWLVAADPPKLHKVKLGDVCCVNLNACDVMSSRKQAPPPKMRRAVVCDNEKRPVKVPEAGVFLLDAGVRRQCLVRDLLALPPSLYPDTVPPLCTPYALYGIAPSCAEWSSLDIQLLWKHLQGKKVFMRNRPASGSKKGCDHVEMYFDPSGKESVVERILSEGYYVARAEVPDQGGRGTGAEGGVVGGGMEPESFTTGNEAVLENGNRTAPEHENGTATGYDTVLPSPPRSSKRGRGLMSMVTSALEMLEMESA